MKSRQLIVASLAPLMISTFISPAFGPFVLAAEKGPLADYVAKKDDAFRWVKRREGTIGATSFVELTLTSQLWKDTLWKHQLFLIKPSTMKKDCHHALLLIEGSDWHPRLAGPVEEVDKKLPDEAPIFAAIAEQLGTPVAVLLQVPHQPILGGKVEDQAIAHTFAQFIKTGDDEWPLLLPMVKSAVRGMDAVQQFAKRDWEMQLDTFTVSGASKRGWTTWLTGAIDPRVTAIAPMVIDMLNMGPQMKHQVESFGDYSRMIDDYTELGLQDQLKTEKGKRLQAIVDPYSYREQLTQPKLIILGSNDDYWPVDALNLYWDDLQGEKYVLYVPNNRHGIKDYARVVGSVNALQHHINGGPKLPKLDWKYEESDKGVTLKINSSIKPQRVRAWATTSATRDFRQSKFQSFDIAEKDGQYQFTLPNPPKGHAAVFGEVVFDGQPLTYYLSTTVKVVSAKAAE